MTPSRGWILLPENRAATQAVWRARACLASGSSRRAVNPLVLHGPPGTGKSRLVECLAADVGSESGRAVRALPAADLATLEDGDRELQRADLLAVEDLQFLPARTLESFVRLLDRGLSRGQQLVFTASTGPALLEGLPARVTSRLSSGLVVALSPLSPASRLEYLRRRADERGVRVGDDALNWLAQHGSGSARQLEAALGRVERLNAGRGRPVGPDELGEAFADDAEARRPTLEGIVALVGRYYRVEPKRLRSSGRSRAVLLPRQVAMYLARSLTGASLERIGAHFGRDHTTVMHACRKVEQGMEDDAELRAAVAKLREGS